MPVLLENNKAGKEKSCVSELRGLKLDRPAIRSELRERSSRPPPLSLDPTPNPSSLSKVRGRPPHSQQSGSAAHRVFCTHPSDRTVLRVLPRRAPTAKYSKGRRIPTDPCLEPGPQPFAKKVGYIPYATTRRRLGHLWTESSSGLPKDTAAGRPSQKRRKNYNYGWWTPAVRVSPVVVVYLLYSTCSRVEPLLLVAAVSSYSKNQTLCWYAGHHNHTTSRPAKPSVAVSIGSKSPPSLQPPLSLGQDCGAASTDAFRFCSLRETALPPPHLARNRLDSQRRVARSDCPSRSQLFPPKRESQSERDAGQVPPSRHLDTNQSRPHLSRSKGETSSPRREPTDAPAFDWRPDRATRPAKKRTWKSPSPSRIRLARTTLPAPSAAPKPVAFSSRP